MAKDKSTAEAFLIALAVAGAAVVFGGQYASCDSVICDWLGSASGWLKTLFGKAQNSIDSATGGGDALDIAVNMIAGYESFRSHAYNDAVGILTIGYGHKIIPGDGFDANSTISESDARDLLRQDASGAYSVVLSSCSGAALSPNQIAALTSLCYNIGEGAFAGSTLVKQIQLGDLQQAQNEFSRWVYAKGVVLPGLVSRRESEAEVFANG
jgi:lysozyme